MLFPVLTRYAKNFCVLFAGTSAALLYVISQIEWPGAVYKTVEKLLCLSVERIAIV